MSMIDYRRVDERDNIRPNPFWVRSTRMDYSGKAGFNSVMDDNQAVFQSFPLGGKGPFPVVVHGALIEILVAFVGGTPLITIGNGTIPTYNSTDGATVSVVTADSIAASALVAPAVVGLKLELALEFTVIPADAVTPVFYAALTSGSPITAGAMRVTMLISEAS